MMHTETAKDALTSFRLEDGPVLLYDGDCGLCAHSVQWILRHERSQNLRFTALKSELGQRLRKEAGVSEDIDSLLWIELSDQKVLAKKWSSSVVATMKYVGGPWRLLASIAIVPPPLRDAFYRLFARHRKRFMPSSCLLPSPETKARFLDR